MTIAFDVDGTLINLDNTPNFEVIDLFRWFQRNGDRCIIWSGGGVEYAKHWGEKLGLYPHAYAVKSSLETGLHGVDIAVDDEFVMLGKVNIKVEARLSPSHAE
jgi:phosphoserine phosphatase